MYVRVNVVLPKWIWTKSKTKEDFKTNVAWYLKRYPGYKVVKLGKYYAICEGMR